MVYYLLICLIFAKKLELLTHKYVEINIETTKIKRYLPLFK